jgi:hypothetical protein
MLKAGKTERKSKQNSKDFAGKSHFLWQSHKIKNPPK